ncbi:hypothetical protein I1A62_30075 [Rhodococcus sp. USK10]|uniref:hypothetical protein n=1 Tax=Rhodococcus sp. USK10 TaxID=2789739 RepID=UPI001C5D374B|nr:hypothetical protein [Rhodococcus sp. USK10]QYB01480.1 hypothetical protein I1A62_30075 [Rhodococcus sp. USK10]
MGHDLAYRGVDEAQSLWHLYGTKAAAENVGLLDHAKGLYLPPGKLIMSKGAYQVGATPRKTVEDERVVEMLIGTRGATSRIHDRVESDWWGSWSMLEPGRLEADGGERWLDVRILEWPDDPWTIHPEVNHFMSHDMRIVACNPAWQGGMRPSIEVTGTGVLTIPGITNLTDRDMWLNVVGTGGGTVKIQDGLSSRIITIPQPLTEGWKVYTDPQQRTLEVDSGLPLWPDIMRGITFRSPIPPGTENASITVQVSSTATVRAEMIDQYSRPWG